MDIAFDDGSVLTYDEAGSVVSQVNGSGDLVAVPPPQGSGIVQQFQALLNYGARAAIDANFRRPSSVPAPGTPQAVAVSTPAQSVARLLPLILGAVAVVFVVKALK